jgi:hypothetical protein
MLDEAKKRSRFLPPLLALNKIYCGRGVERVAFRCHLADGEREDDFRFGAMVAKETRTVERIEENIAFHKSFCKTQDLAAHLAGEFNRRITMIPGFDERSTPKLEFLPCTVLVLEDSDWPEDRRGVLVEKLLDTDRFGWCKWNNNAGAVNGVAAHVPIDVDRELQKIEQGELDVIAEGDSDEESTGDGDEGSVGEAGSAPVWLEPVATTGPGLASAQPADYLQAFTHFSYLFTGKQVMVCDLQGVLNTDRVPPTFELTDPAIHYSSTVGRRMVFGHTDLGSEGMDRFFKTHKCSPVCKYMNLSHTNREWKRHWKSRRPSGRGKDLPDEKNGGCVVA